MTSIKMQSGTRRFKCR